MESNGKERGQKAKARRSQGRRGRKGRPKLPQDVVDKARDLQSRTGIPFWDAVSVVQGKATVQQVLVQLLKKEKLLKLVDKGELDPMFVPAVLSGTMSLDKAKYVTALLRDEAWRSTKSVLDELHASGDRAVFFLFGREPVTATIPQITKYDVWLQPEGGDEAEQTQKHNLIYLCRPEEKDELLSSTGLAEDVAKLGLGPSVNYKDRFRSTKETLYEHHRNRTRTRVTFRDGKVLEGYVGWFGKWEFELEVSPTCRPVIFRHALYALEPANE